MGFGLVLMIIIFILSFLIAIPSWFTIVSLIPMWICALIFRGMWLHEMKTPIPTSPV